MNEDVKYFYQLGMKDLLKMENELIKKISNAVNSNVFNEYLLKMVRQEILKRGGYPS